MKRNIILLPLCLLCAILISSCDDYLEKKPLTQIGNDDYWKATSDLANYTLQFYPSLPAFEVVGSYTGLIGWDGTRGSDTQITGVPSTVWNGSRSPVTSTSDKEWNWTKIRSVNVFLITIGNVKILSIVINIMSGKPISLKPGFILKGTCLWGCPLVFQGAGYKL